MSTNTPTIVMVDPFDVIPTPDNKRRFREDASFMEIFESIKADGIQQPPLARPHPDYPGKYDLRFGERRVRAARKAELPLIPLLVRDMDDHEAQRMTLIENEKRQDLTPLEQADSYQNLLDQGWTVDQLANELGVSPKHVARRAQLTRLAVDWRNGVGEESDRLPSWSASHYEVIAALPFELQQQLLNEFSRWGDCLNSFSVKELRDNVARYTRCLSSAKWKLDDASMPCGACVGCHKRTDAQPLLFDDQPETPGKKLGKAVQCLDSKCWIAKENELVKRKAAELKEQHDAVLYLGDAKNALGVKTLESEWNLTKVKKDTPGAVPALRVSSGYNGNAGEVIYVKPDKGSKAAAKVDGTPQKSLKEKREGLEKARVKIVAVKASEAIGQAEHADFEEDGILALLYIFGTAHSVTSTYHYDSLTHQQDGLELRARRVGTQPHGQILSMLFPTIQHNAEAFARSIANMNKPDVDGLKLCCELWHVDYAELYAEACEEKKEPASWTKQEQAEKAAKKAKVKPTVEKANKPAKPKRGICKACGCTWNTPCPEGCAWTDETETLCTACVGPDGFDLVDDDIPADLDAAHEALATPAKPKRGRKGKAVRA